MFGTAEKWKEKKILIRKVERQYKNGCLVREKKQKVKVK